MAEQPAHFAANGVAVSFDGVPVLRGLSFSAAPGECIALLGANGCGKTTFINIASGFLKADAGTIEFEGQQISGLRGSAIWHRGVSRTFQDGRLFDGMNCLDNVVLPGLSNGMPLAEAESAAEAMLEAVGMKGKLSSEAGSLSAGQRRRLELARALVNRPSLVLLDEITAGVDYRGIPELCDLIVGLHEKTGLTVIMVEHNPRVVRRLATRALFISRGVVSSQAAPDEIFDLPEVRNMYLGVAGA